MSMSWHAGGSDYLIRHIKRLGQTEQTGKERLARWGPSNCLRHTVGVCVSGWRCEKVCAVSFACLSLACVGLRPTACRNVSVWCILVSYWITCLRRAVVAFFVWCNGVWLCKSALNQTCTAHTHTHRNTCSSLRAHKKHQNGNLKDKNIKLLLWYEAITHAKNTCSWIQSSVGWIAPLSASRFNPRGGRDY